MSENSNIVNLVQSFEHDFPATLLLGEVETNREILLIIENTSM